MAKFRKKPVEIEAVSVSEVLAARGSARWVELPDWLRHAVAMDRVNFLDGGEAAVIETMEGTMVARAEDWILRGVLGEIYPCKPDIFAMTYEAV